MCSLLSTRFLWWCNNISSMPNCTLKPSQNRTCAVNASGSQLTPVTLAEQSALPIASLRISTRHRNQVHDPAGVRQRMLSKVRVVGIPTDPRVLTPTPQPTQPHPAGRFPVFHHPTPIVIDVVVLKVTLQLRTEGLPDFRCRFRQVRAEPSLEFPQLRPQLLRRRLPFQLELACAAPAAVMREAKEVERAGGAFPTPRGFAGGKAAKPQQFRLVLSQLQREPGQPLR